MATTGANEIAEDFTSLAGALKLLGQSTQQATESAHQFSESALVSRQALHVFSTFLPKGASEVINNTKHAFEQFGPEVGAVVAVMSIAKEAYEAQTEAILENAKNSVEFTSALKGARYFLDDLKDSVIKQQFDKLAVEGAKLRQEQIDATSTWGQFKNWWMGTGEANEALIEFKQKALGRTSGELNQRATEIGDTGTEAKTTGQVGGQGNRAVGARELGKFQLDHQAQMVSLLGTIAAATSETAAHSGGGGQQLGNPNSSIAGIPSSKESAQKAFFGKPMQGADFKQSQSATSGQPSAPPPKPLDFTPAPKLNSSSFELPKTKAKSQELPDPNSDFFKRSEPAAEGDGK